MKINLIRFANSIDPNAPYLKDSESFINDINDELFDRDLCLEEKAEDACFSVIFIETGGSEQKFVKEYANLPRPIVLLSHCKNNSLPACMEIKTYVEAHKESAVLVFGDEKMASKSLYALSKVMVAKKELEAIKAGVIGEPSDWLIASRVDYQEVKRVFGVELIDITIDELKSEIEKEVDFDIPHLVLLKEKTFDKDVLDGAIKIYCGLKRIVNKYSLKGFTLRCFDLLSEYKNTACLAFALLNEEGIVAACEGDVPSLLTMLIINAATKFPSFMANPSRIDINKSTMLFAHCTLPLNMCKKYTLMTHFESGLGIGVRGELEKKEVTVVKVAPNLKDILCVKGEIIDNPNLEGYCRTQITVKFDVEEMFDFLKDSFGNHVLIAYGDIADQILTIHNFLLDVNKIN